MSSVTLVIRMKILEYTLTTLSKTPSMLLKKEVLKFKLEMRRLFDEIYLILKDEV